MNNSDLVTTINSLLDAIERLIPEYMQDPRDQCISGGNLAACIIDESGMVYGKMFGKDKPRLRQSYKIAWTKASQVLLTGIKTGEYEKMVFNKEVGENANGIDAPDLIGWEGGQPLVMKNGTRFSVGFSGFRGVTDLEIMVKALAYIEQQ